MSKLPDILTRVRNRADAIFDDESDDLTVVVLNHAAAEIERLRGLLDHIAKQRTVSEWEQFAEDEGLDPDGADYTEAYDSIIRDVRAARKEAGL